MSGMLKAYLGHDKVIHFRDNLPVISSLTPPLFSKPSANFFVRVFQGVIQNRTFPNFLSFAITESCNASCSHCSFFSEACKKKKNILTIDECKKVIKESQLLGVSMIAFVGGEPLLREGIEKIIASVDKNLSTTTLFTNGWFLAEKACKLKAAGLDSVFVSIDSAEEKKHDAIRGKEGMFKKALEGIEAVKNSGLTVGISCCVGKDDFKNGELDKIIELGKKIGVHEVLVFSAIPTGRLKNCEEMVDDEWGNEIVHAVEKYNQNQNYPGIVSYSHMTNYQGFGCMGGTRYFYINPYGDVNPCDFNHAVFGNILEEPLFKIWDKMSSQKEFQQATWGGCKVKNSQYRDNSEIVNSGI